jgi:virginiamycin B lyase
VAVTGVQTYASNISLAIGLNNLPNLSTAVSAAYDNTTTGYMTMEVQFSVTCNLSTTDYFAPTSRTPYVYLYLLKSVDGGVTYDDTDINNAELLRIEWTRAANSNVAQQYFASVLVDSVPQFFKFMIYNATGFHICIAHPHGITSAPDGNLWANDGFEQRLWKITTAGAISWYTAPSDTTFGLGPSSTGTLGDITVGPDSNLWVSDFYYERVWEITTTPTFTPYRPISSNPNGICYAPSDSNLWLCDNMGYVWRVTTAGVATSFLLGLGAPLTGICFSSITGDLWVCATDGFVWNVTTGGFATSYFIGGTLTGICEGSDFNLWASDSTGFAWKITTGGVGTSYALVGGTPTGIAAGSDFNLWLCDTAASGQVWQVTTAGVPTAFSLGAFALPTGITGGPDSNLWLSDSLGKAWKVTTLGVPTSYILSGFFCSPRGITSGPDGNLWVADEGGGSFAKVWKVTTGGVGTSYFTFTTPFASNRAIASDGFDLWVADFRNHAIKVTTSGTVTPYNLITFLTPRCVTGGSDGNMYMSEGLSEYIWKISTAGVPFYYIKIPGATGIQDMCSGPDGNIWIAGGSDGNVWEVDIVTGVPTAYFLGGIVYGICSGPDGNLWVANSDGNIYKVTTAGVPTSYATGSFPRGICSHTDGNLWATGATDKVMKVTTAGAVTLYTLTGANVNDTLNICSGPDGNLWVNDFLGKIWKVTTGGVGTSYTLIVDTAITVSGKYDTYS